MPSAYVADPTVAQAPSPAPDPENYPIPNLPINGEPRNADSVNQCFKALADHNAYLKKPFAKPSAWTQPLKRFQDAKRYDRFVIDHHGLPAGKLIHFRESWLSDESQTGGNGSGNFSSLGSARWAWKRNVTSGNAFITIETPNLAAGRPMFRVLSLTPSIGVGDSVSVGVNAAPCQFHPDNVIAMEWDAALTAIAGTTNVDWRMGFAIDADPFSTFGGAEYYALFIKQNGVANWKAQTRDGVTTGTLTDTGVAAAANVFQRFRLVWAGANVSDDGVARCMFFINGALVANLTANLPGSAPEPNCRLGFGGKTVGVPTGASIMVGPTNFAANTWQNAAF